jgi:hypothetical protein
LSNPKTLSFFASAFSTPGLLSRFLPPALKGALEGDFPSLGVFTLGSHKGEHLFARNFDRIALQFLFAFKRRPKLLYEFRGQLGRCRQSLWACRKSGSKGQHLQQNGREQELTLHG